jgi:uncharacterized protein (TIGR01777 family)
MKIVLSGGSGLIGTALLPVLQQSGHEVIRLVRHEPSSPGEVRWDPLNGRLNPADLEGVDAAIHLSGAGVGSRRWTKAYRRTLLDSRVKSTTLLAQTLAKLSPQPKVLLSGSAVGYYGDTGDELLDESGRRGKGFLADLVLDWEASTSAAEAAGIRVVHLRSGIVLSRRGGALKLQLPLFKAGLGGKLGSGRQYFSWIGIDDEVAAIAFLLTAEQVSGPVNLVAPNPVTNKEFTKALGRVLHRPTFAAAPAFALRIALDGFADEGLLIGQRLTPRVLQDAGFAFVQPELADALKAILAE